MSGDFGSYVKLDGYNKQKKKLDLTGQRVDLKAETSLKQFCIFSWDFFPCIALAQPKNNQ